MQRKNLLNVSLAIILSLAVPAANAWPLGRLFHLHPAAASAKDSRVSFQLYNKSGIIQDIEINGRRYSLMPRSGLGITAPEGTQVISQTAGLGHNRGDVLFSVQRSLQSDTVMIR